MKFGVIGTNFVSDSFMQGISAVPACEAIAVCSGRKENAIRFAEKYQIPHVFDHYEQMYESNLLDAVYIATPNAMHFEQAKYFLERQIPVFCEKPMAVNVRQVKELIQIAKEHHTYLHDGIMPLYSPNFSILQDLIKEIAPIRRAVFTFEKYSSRYDAYLNGQNPTTFRRELANGAFMDLGIYTISDAVALFGTPHNIYASAQLLDTGVDCINSAIFQYDGFDAIIQNSKVSTSMAMSEIQGERGTIQFHAPSNLLAMTLTKQGEETKTIDVDLHNPFKHQLEDFYTNITNGSLESAKCPHALTIAIHEVLTTCRMQCKIIYPQDESTAS